MADTPAQPDQPYVDPHHAVPAEQWGQVVRDAQAFRSATDESETD
jgi:hypothetical protein